MFKSILAALVAALFMSGCATVKAGLPECEQAVNGMVKEELVAGRRLVFQGQAAAATFLFVFSDGSPTAKGIMIALPGSLVPPEDSPYKQVASCNFEGKEGRIYRADLEFEETPGQEAKNEAQ